jgi:tetraacyldisaccharide 4'-kinase
MRQIFSVFRFLLYPLAPVYGAVVWLRNRLYDAGFYSSIEFSPPVIAVGNLSTGGTGKTPHIEYLVRLLQYRYRVATMSRGYKRRTQGFQLADENTNALRIGDEPMQYHLKFPELIVSVAEERITGIPRLIQLKPETEVVLLDDAFQHRSVKAGLNILITDYARPFYEDYILPIGSLREQRKAYERADIIIVSKCPSELTREAVGAIELKINPLSHQEVYFSYIRYERPYDLFTKEEVSISGSNVILVCGIAKPEPLVKHMEGAAENVHVLSYNDHHYFYSRDLEEIKAAYDNWDKKDKLVVTTEKDAARLLLHADKLKEWGIRIAVLPIAIDIMLDKAGAFDSQVLNYVESTLFENNPLNYQ